MGLRTRNAIISPKTLIFVIICFSLGLALGLLIGTTMAWKACIDVGFNFLHLNGIELSIDEQLVKDAVNHYKKSIGNWLFDSDSPFTINKTS